MRRALLLVCLALCGCAGLQGLSPRATPADPASFSAEKTLQGHTGGDWPREDWWKRYGDAQLDRLIGEALASSPTTRIAQARVDRAIAAAQASGAARAPQVDASADMTRQRYSANGFFPPPIAGSTYTQTQLAASLNWDLDLFGRNRARYESAVGAARAAEVDAFAARLVLSTGIARLYFQLARSFEQLDLARKSLEEREMLQRLTAQRVGAGLDSRLELKQVETSIPAARRRIVQLDEEIAVARAQLAALAGKGPDRGLEIARPAPQPAAVGVPTSVPADLLGRRPDVVAQRWRVESSRRAIDAAKAEFYPDVNLAALIGVQSITLSRLLDAGSAIPSLGAAVRLPLFDGGRLRGNLAARDADYDLAVEQYNQTLADALREVVEQLAALRSVHAQRAEVESALGAAEEAYQIAVDRYHARVGNYLQVIAAEQPVLEQRVARADLQARELDVSVALVRALGGGMEPAQ
ncbi:MAG TPA: efflux transporter outer membrane subunit [Burkholderiales bacterium]|nr:efflux transporter outer membrane subunit [Burkholderiales bacterium]